MAVDILGRGNLRAPAAPARPCWPTEIAAALNKPLIQWHIKSAAKAQQGLSGSDAVSRLRNSQFGEAASTISAITSAGANLWDAFEANTASVLLIDEIDKANIEYPNDLLLELDHIELLIKNGPDP